MDDLEFDAEVTSSDDDDSDDDGPSFTMIDMGTGGVHCFQAQGGITVLSEDGHIYVGDNTSIVFGETEERSARREQGSSKPHGDEKIKLSESKAPPSRQDLDFVCNNIGRRWKRLGYDLGLSRGQIATIEADFHVEGVYEMCWQMLLKWSRSRGDQARICDLVEALRESGLTELARALPVR